MLESNVQPDDSPKEESIASITYYVTKEDSDVRIDIGVEDNSSEAIGKLCDILDVLAQDAFYVETIKIIKESLGKAGEHELLMKFLLHIGSQSNRLKSLVKDTARNKPCISPSDMLQ